MNQSQVNQVKGKLEEFSSIDIVASISTTYNDVSDLNSIAIGEYSAKEYVSTVNKVFAQFSQEIDGVYAKAMPFTYHFQNEYGNGNLHQDLSNLINQINAKNFPASIPQLNKLIHYQAINGFWEKSKRKYFRSSEINLKEDQERVDLVSKHMKEVSVGLADLIRKIEEEKEELNLFIKSKNSELNEIESMVSSARQHTSEITEIVTNTSTLDERVSLMAEQADEKKSDIERIVDNVKEIEDKFKSVLKVGTKNTELQKESNEQLVHLFEEKLNFVESKKQYFEERNKYLDDLIEREVGASLFETFKQRKTELVTSLSFWKWAIPLTAVATIAWIFFLFGNGDLSSLPWQVIVVNSLKALPAVGLLLFAISQYSKERNFQEEYAFKSAVALTVNSYADQLRETENKDKMIMDSVSQIYRSPIHQKGIVKDQSAVAASAHELLKTAKSMVTSDK